MAHTPTPWEILFEGGVPHIAKTGPRFEGETIARTYGDFESPTIDKGNAELIVRAVNNHQALVNALQAYVEYDEETSDCPSCPDCEGGCINATAREVLAQATQHEPGCLCPSCEVRS